MFVIDFNATPAQSFAQGFIKGLAAPVMLYHVETAPEAPHISPIQAPPRLSCDALAGDWCKIGRDLRAVIDQHGKTSAG